MAVYSCKSPRKKVEKSQQFKNFDRKRSEHLKTLTRHEGDGRELLVPLVGDLDGLLRHGLTRRGVTLLVGVLDQGLGVLGHKSVHYVPKVLAVRAATLGEFRGKVPHEVPVVLHLWPEVEHRQLVEEGHVDSLDHVEWHQSLLLGQYLLEEVLVPTDDSAE